MYNIYNYRLLYEQPSDDYSILLFSSESDSIKAKSETSETKNNYDFETILKQYYKSIYNLVFRTMLDRDEAYDITQEVFINAYKALSRFEGEYNAIFPWLCKIAINCSNNRFRERGRQNKYEAFSIDEPIDMDTSSVSFEIPDESTDPEGIVQTKAMGEMIQAAINNLPPAYRIVVMLRDIHGLTYKEISEAAEISMDQVKVRLNRARETLRRQLSTYINE